MPIYDNQLERLEAEISDGTIDEATAELLDEFVRAERAEVERGELAATTLKNHAFYLRKMATRSTVPLAAASLDDLEATLKAMRTGQHPDVKDSGIGVGNYQSALRVFYRFHAELGVDPDEIEIEKSSGRDLSAEDLLYQDDVDALLDACYENQRDRAFIALALSTAQRLDALRTLRLRHLEVGDRTMEITLNREEGHLKGARGSKPLLWAKHHVRPWVENHPYADDPDAALFVPIPDSVPARDDVEAGEPMHGSSFRRLLDKRAELAGLEKKVYPHLLRHTGITRMVQEGLPAQQIKKIAGEGGKWDQFDTYVHLADELNNDAIRKRLGYPDSGNEIVVGKPTVTTCSCGEQYPPTMPRCPTCGGLEGEAGPSIEAIVGAFREDPDRFEAVLDRLQAEGGGGI